MPLSSCQNTCKQIALALQLHHDAKQRLPPGSSRDQPPFGAASTNLSGWGGMLVPNAKMKLSDCTDGTAKMLVFGEQSGMFVDTSGVRQSWSPSSRFGWPLGCAGTTNTVANLYNVTTIRWPINQKTGWEGLTYGVGSGQSSGWPSNVPLTSNHPGGANLGMLDGSVRFAADATSMQVLGQLATRDDGITSSGEF